MRRASRILSQGVRNRYLPLFTTLMLSASMATVSVAQDIDPLLACLPPAAGNVGSGAVLFVLDDSSSMDGAPWDGLVSSYTTIINELPDNMNVGTILFSSGTMGGYVAHPVAPLGAAPSVPLRTGIPGDPPDTVRGELINAIALNEINGGTPTQGALLEAANYVRGGPVLYGKKRLQVNPQPRSWLINPFNYSGIPNTRRDFVSHPASWRGGTGIVPANCTWAMTSACEREEILGNPTYISPFESLGISGDMVLDIILISDGAPAGPTRPDLIDALAGTENCLENDGEAGDGYDDRCIRTLAGWLGSQTDLAPSIPGNQTVRVSAISYASGSRTLEVLRGVAENGGGQVYEAGDADALVDALRQIIQPPEPYDVPVEDTLTFTAAAKQITPGSLYETDEDVYFSVFGVSRSAAWPGNLKRYGLEGDTIVGANDVVAIDPATGGFQEDVRSYWSPEVDGNDPALGGAASQLPASRTLRIDSATTPATLQPFSAATVSAADFGPGIDAAQVPGLVDWVSGNTPDQRHSMGDALHSRPVVLTYDGTVDNGLKVAFFGTNQGYLHAIDVRNGRELFGFLARETLPNVPILSSGSGSGHPYGLDGSPVLWIQNQGDLNKIDASENDRVILFIGMRRGGKNYYAFDVTDPSAPDLLWRIEGGAGDFAKLGQTWSTPVPAKIQIEAATRDVLIFGGGYDATQDAVTTRTADTEGNALYIVDAVSGDLIWMASNAVSGPGMALSEMNYSVPADVKVVDINTDGLADTIVFADMGGQVWRVNINNGAPLGDAFTGQRIADLAGTGAADHRRFFNQPDVSLLRADNRFTMAIALGSGARSDLLRKTVTDRFYVLLTSNVFGGGASELITESDLLDRTTDLSDTPNPQGWYFTLPQAGEKVISPAITLNNSVLFTSYVPPASAETACVMSSYLWAMNLLDGKPTTLDLAGSGTGSLISGRGIALGGTPNPLPQLSFRITESGPVVLAGPQRIFPGETFGLVDEWSRQFWYQRQ